MKHLPSRTSLLAPLAMTALVAGCELHLQTGWDSSSDDVEAPYGVGDLGVETAGRGAAIVRFRAPMDTDGAPVAGYELRLSSSASGFRDGELLPAPRAAAPGSMQRTELRGLRPGTAYYLSVAAVDAAGNRSPFERVGPIVTDLVTSGARTPLAPEDGDNALGYQLAYGRFDGDGYDDLAVAAPFKAVGDLPGAGVVYLYRGGPDGIGDEPDQIIEGRTAYAQLGNGLAALDWNDDGIDDLAVGAPFADDGAGAAYVYFGAGALGTTRTLDEGAADVRISAAGSAAAGTFGFSLASARFDGDDRDDLVVGAITAGDVGAVVVVYGGSATGDVELGATGTASLIADPDPSRQMLFGATVVGAGRLDEHDDGESIAVSRFDDGSVFVVRGRADRPAGAGLHELAIDLAVDLEITSDEPGIYFGAALGSIARSSGRELVIGSYLAGDEAGRAVLVDVSQAGSHPVAELATAVIDGDLRFATAIANPAAARTGDVDGDGLEDLVIIGGEGAVELFVWYGDDLPQGKVDVTSAAYTLVAPVEMTAGMPSIGGTPMTATFAGDLDGDGLEDLAWADWADNDRDGAFEVLR